MLLETIELLDGKIEIVDVTDWKEGVCEIVGCQSDCPKMLSINHPNKEGKKSLICLYCLSEIVMFHQL